MTSLNGYLDRLRAGVAWARNSALVRSGAGLGGLTAVEMALAILSSILLARQLGLEGLGVYSLVLAVVALAGLPVEHGLPSLVMREIARSEAESEAGSDAVRGMIVFAATTITVLSATLVPVVLVISSSLALGLGVATPETLGVAVLLIPVNAFCKMLGATLAGRHKVVLGNVPFRLVRPAGFAAALAVLSVAEPGWLTPARAIIVQLATGMLALGVAASLFLVHFRATLRQGGRVVRWRAWLAAMLRLSGASGMMQAQPQLLLLLTGALGSVEAVGLLRIALRGADVVIAGAMVAQTAAAPRIARLLAEGAQAPLQRLLPRIARVAFSLSLGGLVGFLLAGQWLLATLFGPEFVAAWHALLVLTAAHGIVTLLGPGVMLMNMARREAVTLSGHGISLTVAVALGTVLIPTLGVLGSACARVTGVVAHTTFVRHRARRDLGIDPAVTAGPGLFS